MPNIFQIAQVLTSLGRLCKLALMAALIILPLDNQVNSKNKQQNAQVGKTSKVSNLVIGDNLNVLRELNKNDPVYALERISAEADSHGEILLNDNSHIVVGPGAEIFLDDFVVGNSGIESATVNVLKGAFRFVSGNSPKGTFKIKTPLATIGIRGTLFDVYVKPNGKTDVILYSGEVNVCTLSNKCKKLNNTCDIVSITSRKQIRSKKFLRSGNRIRENQDYNLVQNQFRFQKRWQAPIRSCDVRAAKARINKFNKNRQDGPGSDPDPDVSVSAAPSAPAPAAPSAPAPAAPSAPAAPTPTAPTPSDDPSGPSTDVTTDVSTSE